jgi:serine/threonine protein phosphatase PrpC
MRDGFQRTDADFLQQCRQYGFVDGSTCLVTMIIDNKLICGHAGDSRVVLCRDKKAVRLTEDHKPDRVDELARIEEAGGEVIFRGNCFRVSGDLAMSRSFGDLRLKEPLQLVICDPEIRMEELTPKDQFLILASDGLWDVLTDQKAVEIVRKCTTPEEGAKKLVETALQMGTMDNTTAIVVKLNWALDFLTQDEIDGKILAKEKKKEKSKYGDPKHGSQPFKEQPLSKVDSK